MILTDMRLNFRWRDLETLKGLKALSTSTVFHEILLTPLVFIYPPGQVWVARQQRPGLGVRGAEPGLAAAAAAANSRAQHGRPRLPLPLLRPPPRPRRPAARHGDVPRTGEHHVTLKRRSKGRFVITEKTPTWAFS